MHGVEPGRDEGAGMDVERTMRDSWAIPRRCCVCGEPATDGKPFAASVTLSRTMGTAGTLDEIDTVSTSTATLEFPRCAACERAQRAKEKNDAVAVAVGALVGFTGCVYAAAANAGAVPWLVFAVAWIAIVYAAQTVVDRRWVRTADEDTLRRAKLSRLPVEVKKTRRAGGLPTLRFRFANEDYGQDFAGLNP